jgi:hypothetical protein
MKRILFASQLRALHEQLELLLVSQAACYLVLLEVKCMGRFVMRRSKGHIAMAFPKSIFRLKLV